MLLVGDIGGTKTLLAVYPSAPGHPPVHSQRFNSTAYSDFTQLLAEFTDAISSIQLHRCVLAVAGPVLEQGCHATNLPWRLDGKEIAATLKLPASACALVNDLSATAVALPELPASSLHTITSGRFPSPPGHRALIAPGTGLGEAILYWDGYRHHPMASEGGHCDFAPRSDEELALWRFAHKRLNGHVSVERLVSGPGITLIYEFFLSRANTAPQHPIKLGDAGTSAEITRRGLRDQDPLCRQTLQTFVALLAAEAGNLALKSLSLDGLYIAGGIAPTIITALDSTHFRANFFAKGRMESLLRRVTVDVCLEPKAALLGALAMAQGTAPGAFDAPP